MQVSQPIWDVQQSEDRYVYRWESNHAPSRHLQVLCTTSTWIAIYGPDDSLRVPPEEVMDASTLHYFELEKQEIIRICRDSWPVACLGYQPAAVVQSELSNTDIDMPDVLVLDPFDSTDHVQSVTSSSVLSPVFSRDSFFI